MSRPAFPTVLGISTAREFLRENKDSLHPTRTIAQAREFERKLAVLIDEVAFDVFNGCCHVQDIVQDREPDAPGDRRRYV